MNSAGILQEGPLVTVYVPCRNYGHYLAQAVASVRNQLYRNWELFIIDEGSEDETAKIADALSLAEPDRIIVLRHETPLGLQRTANEVLGLAKGRFIMRLDADDWLDESALLLMVAKLESDRELGLVYGNYYYTDEAGHVIGIERRRKLGVEEMSMHLAPHGACTMVRVRALKAVGGYSEDVDAQDGWELWYKLLAKVKAASLDAPVFYYRQHAQSLSIDSHRLLNARAKIVEKAKLRLEGSYRPSCLAVLPVRESYPGFEGVPYETLHGRSLLEISLLSACEASGVTRVAVSSASPAVLAFASQLADTGRVPEHMRILRTGMLSGSHMRLRETLMHAAEAYQDETGVLPDILMFLSLHAPRRTARHVGSVIDTLLVTGADSVVSVCEEREPVFTHGPNGLALLNPGRFEEVAYERERLFSFNGAAVAVWTEIVANGSLFGESIGYVEMSRHDSVQIKQHSDLSGMRVDEAPRDEPSVRPTAIV